MRSASSIETAPSPFMSIRENKRSITVSATALRILDERVDDAVERGDTEVDATVGVALKGAGVFIRDEGVAVLGVNSDCLSESTTADEATLLYDPTSSGEFNDG